MSYTIEYSKSARKSLLKLDPKIKSRFLVAFEIMSKSESIDHDTLDIKQLKGVLNGYYRLRIGSYRAVFDVNNGMLLLLILKIHPRGDVYKG